MQVCIFFFKMCVEGHLEFESNMVHSNMIETVIIEVVAKHAQLDQYVPSSCPYLHVTRLPKLGPTPNHFASRHRPTRLS